MGMAVFSGEDSIWVDDFTHFPRIVNRLRHAGFLVTFSLSQKLMANFIFFPHKFRTAKLGFEPTAVETVSETIVLSWYLKNKISPEYKTTERRYHYVQ